MDIYKVYGIVSGMKETLRDDGGGGGGDDDDDIYQAVY